jgi:hypothetical protein
MVNPGGSGQFFFGSYHAVKPGSDLAEQAT